MKFTGRESTIFFLFFIVCSMLTLLHGYHVAGGKVSSIPLKGASGSLVTDYQSELRSVTAAHLFGQEKRQQPQVRKVLRTPLSVELTGVLSGSAGAMAMLVINGKQQAYKVGAALPFQENVLVKRVEADRVVLDREGEDQELILHPAGIAEGVIIHSHVAGSE